MQRTAIRRSQEVSQASINQLEAMDQHESFRSGPDLTQICMTEHVEPLETTKDPPIADLSKIGE